MSVADPGNELRPDDFAFVYLDVDHPPIAWLAYRGILNSCDLPGANPGNCSWFLLDNIKRGLESTLRREGILEGFRAKEFANCLSRLQCLYAYPTLEMARRGDYGRGKFRSENLVAIAPIGAIKAEMYDSTWITNFDSLRPEVARHYWAGQPTSDPLQEYLLSGKFIVLGTAVRQRAYETIKRAYPNSLAMLELSRLAAEFGSDLGSVAPWLKVEESRIRVCHIMRYSDSEGMDIFRKALNKRNADPTVQMNRKDLEPLCTTASDPSLDAKFVVPDFTKFDHELRTDKLTELIRFFESVWKR